MFVALEQLERGKNAIDTVIHEMAHHSSGAEDGDPAHAAEINNMAEKVVASVASRKYDALLRNPDFSW
jgi:dTDP-4-dehydrorhamnose reductase